MSGRARTCKRACYRGVKRIRRMYWRATRRTARGVLSGGQQPEPASHRHAEKWGRE